MMTINQFEAKTLTTPELARLIGVPASTLREWKHSGLVRPSKLGGRRGAPNRYDESTALAVVLMAAARMRGVDRRTAGTLYRTFLSRPLADIRRDVAEGRDHLIVCRGSALPLCRLEDVAANRTGFALAEKLGVGYVVVNVREAIAELDAALAEIRGGTGDANRLDTYPVHIGPEAIT